LHRSTPRGNELPPLHLIDAFADGPFTGNPAAVVFLDAVRDDRWMQLVAMEMNQAETAFLRQQEGGFALRWFTPKAEVRLCGHATLASAHFLWESGTLAAGALAEFETLSGRLTARQAEGGGITIDLPAIRSQRIDASPGLAEALGAVPVEVLRGNFDLLCVLDSAATVRSLAPDLAAIARADARGVIVTARGDQAGIDIVSRFFAPKLGVPEDPVTGSAHCALAPYWQGVLGQNELTAYQASPRGGTLRCSVKGDRVELTGRAVTTLRGTLAG